MQELAALFPESDWVLCQAATAQYNLRNFDMSQSLFEELRARDPFRIEVRMMPLGKEHTACLCAGPPLVKILCSRLVLMGRSSIRQISVLGFPTKSCTSKCQQNMGN